LSKPHEEIWDNPEDFEVTVLGPELDRGIDGPREVLARAAPDMARALLDVLRCQNKIKCGTCEQVIIRVLVKAGVPLP
jgi:hypothetical protein